MTPPNTFGFAVGQPGSAVTIRTARSHQPTLDTVHKLTDEQIENLRLVTPSAKRVDDSKTLSEIADDLSRLRQEMLDAGKAYDGRFDQAAVDTQRKAELLAQIADLRKQLDPLENELADIESKPEPLKTYVAAAQHAENHTSYAARHLFVTLANQESNQRYGINFEQLSEPLKDAVKKLLGPRLDRIRTNYFVRLHNHPNPGLAEADATMKRADEAIQYLSNLIEDFYEPRQRYFEPSIRRRQGQAGRRIQAHHLNTR